MKILSDRNHYSNTYVQLFLVIDWFGPGVSEFAKCSFYVSLYLFLALTLAQTLNYFTLSVLHPDLVFSTKPFNLFPAQKTTT